MPDVMATHEIAYKILINDWAAVRQNPQVFRSPACSYEI